MRGVILHKPSSIVFYPALFRFLCYLLPVKYANKDFSEAVVRLRFQRHFQRFTLKDAPKISQNLKSDLNGDYPLPVLITTQLDERWKQLLFL